MVHSNVWWSGKNDNKVSVGYILDILAIAIMLDVIFFCESITPFEVLVVPDVKIKMLIFSLSTLIFWYLSSPFFNFSFPLSIKPWKDKIPSLSFFKSIFM